jgi:hypothetical protein
MKVKLYTHAHNRPDFIPLQLRSFARFLTDDFEYLVFNNAATASDDREIRETCARLGVECIEVEERNHLTVNCSHASALQWSFHQYLKYETECIAAILDSDMFMISDFSLNDYLDGYDLAGVSQSRGHVYYLTNDIIFFNMAALPDKDAMNFMCDKIEGVHVDVGGDLYYWLKNNPSLRIRYIKSTGQIWSGKNNLQLLPEAILNDYDDDYKFSIVENAFLHYGRGSNWDRKSEEYHRNKTGTLIKFLELCREKPYSG